MRDDEIEAMAEFLILRFCRWPAMEITCSPAEHVAWKTTKRSAILSEAKGLQSSGSRP